MSGVSSKLTEDVLSLPVESRLALIDLLVQSLNLPTRPEIDQAWAREAERRMAEVDRGEIKPEPAGRVFDRIRKRLASQTLEGVQ